MAGSCQAAWHFYLILYSVENSPLILGVLALAVMLTATALIVLYQLIQALVDVHAWVYVLWCVLGNLAIAILSSLMKRWSFALVKRGYGFKEYSYDDIQNALDLEEWKDRFEILEHMVRDVFPDIPDCYRIYVQPDLGWLVHGLYQLEHDILVESREQGVDGPEYRLIPKGVAQEIRGLDL